jgi:hypothetical protein
VTVHDPPRWTFVPPELVVVELELDAGWVAIVTVATQERSPVVAGLEIRPDPPGAIPRGGLTTRTARRARLDGALEAAREALHVVGADDDLAWRGFDRDRLDTSPRKRRTSRYSERYCAEVAAAYVDAIKQRCKPVRRCVAERMSRETGVECSEEHVRDVLRVARKHELLSPAQHGVARGHLLPKGIAALPD